MQQGQRGFGEGIERLASESTCDDLRRYPWLIPRSEGAIQAWRRIARHQLPLYGRLCR
jgi:hypothetical protein